jgi:hypothetical protein
MKNLSIMFVVSLSLAAFGCKKKGGADCVKAIANSMEVSKADMAKMPGVDDKMMEKMKDLGTQHCKDDKWSDDTIKCMSDAKSQTDAQACYSKMTPDQKDKMTKAMMDLMMPPGGGAGAAGGATGGSAGAATGSDTGAAGSAAAGSAAGATDTGGSAGSAAAPK